MPDSGAAGEGILVDVNGVHHPPAPPCPPPPAPAWGTSSTTAHCGGLVEIDARAPLRGRLAPAIGPECRGVRRPLRRCEIARNSAPHGRGGGAARRRKGGATHQGHKIEVEHGLYDLLDAEQARNHCQRVRLPILRRAAGPADRVLVLFILKVLARFWRIAAPASSRQAGRGREGGVAAAAQDSRAPPPRRSAAPKMDTDGWRSIQHTPCHDLGVGGAPAAARGVSFGEG